MTKKIVIVSILLLVITTFSFAEIKVKAIDLIGKWERVQGAAAVSGSDHYLYYDAIEDNKSTENMYKSEYKPAVNSAEVRYIREFYSNGTGEVRMEVKINNQYARIIDHKKSWEPIDSAMRVETFNWEIKNDELFIEVTNDDFLENVNYYNLQDKVNLKYGLGFEEHETVKKLLVLINEGKYEKIK